MIKAEEYAKVIYLASTKAVWRRSVYDGSEGRLFLLTSIMGLDYPKITNLLIRLRARCRRGEMFAVEGLPAPGGEDGVTWKTTERRESGPRIPGICVRGWELEEWMSSEQARGTHAPGTPRVSGLEALSRRGLFPPRLGEK
jgi:hypothetical protein